MGTTVIMVWLTRTLAAAQLAASAGQYNAWLRTRCLQIQQYCKNNYSIPRNYLNRFHLQQRCLGKRLLEVAHPRPVQAPASGHCWRPDALPAQPQPADADGTSRSLSVQGSQTHASKPEGEDRSSQRSPRTWIKPEVLVEKQSMRGNPKHESKP